MFKRRPCFIRLFYYSANNYMIHNITSTHIRIIYLFLTQFFSCPCNLSQPKIRYNDPEAALHLSLPTRCDILSFVCCIVPVRFSFFLKEKMENLCGKGKTWQLPIQHYFSKFLWNFWVFSFSKSFSTVVSTLFQILSRVLLRILCISDSRQLSLISASFCHSGTRRDEAVVSVATATHTVTIWRTAAHWSNVVPWTLIRR